MGAPGSTVDTLSAMDSGVCLLTVHAHPDDEASKGAGTVARYQSAGVRTVLVCCTGGEEGEILNPAMDRPEVRDNLHAVRMQELAAAAVRDLVGRQDPEFEATAQRVLEKNRELYERLR